MDSPDPEPSEEGEEGHEEGELHALHTPTSSSSARATALLVCQLLSLAFLYHAMPFLDYCRNALRGRDPVARSGAQRALQRQLRERPHGTGSPEELLAALPLGQGMAAEAAAAQLTARLQLGDEEVLRQADQVAAAAGLQPLPRPPHLQQQHQQQGSYGAGPSSSSSSSSRLPSWAARVACEQRDIVQWVVRRLEGSTSGEAADISLGSGVDGRQWHACLLHPRHRGLLHADARQFAGSMHGWAGISGHDHVFDMPASYRCLDGGNV